MHLIQFCLETIYFPINTFNNLQYELVSSIYFKKKLYLTYLSPDKNLIKCPMVKFIFKCIFVKQKKHFLLSKSGYKHSSKTNKQNFGKSYTKDTGRSNH